MSDWLPEDEYLAQFQESTASRWMTPSSAKGRNVSADQFYGGTRMYTPTPSAQPAWYSTSAMPAPEVSFAKGGKIIQRSEATGRVLLTPPQPDPVFQAPEPPYRYEANVFGLSSSDLMNSPIGVLGGVGQGAQRGGIMSVNPGIGGFSFGLATMPVNMANFAAYGREGALALFSSIFGGSHYQQPENFWEQPEAPEEDRGLFDDVIGGLATIGDAMWAPFQAFSDWSRDASADDRGRAVREIANGREVNLPLIGNVMSILTDPERRTPEGILKKSQSMGLSVPDTIAELYDMSPEQVNAILANPEIDDAALHDLMRGTPYSRNGFVNLAMELAVSLPSMAVGLGELRGAGMIGKTLGSVARASTGGKALSATAGVGGTLARGALGVGRAVAAVDRGLFMSGLGIRGGEWALKQIGHMTGAQGVVETADRLLWETPLSQNPGWQLIDAFGTHPIADLRRARAERRIERELVESGAATMPDPTGNGPTVRIGSEEVPISPEVAAARDRIATLSFDDLVPLIKRIGWPVDSVRAVFGDGGEMPLSTLKNGLYHVAMNVVRIRQGPLAKHFAGMATAKERSVQWMKAYDAAGIELLEGAIHGTDDSLPQMFRAKFWEEGGLAAESSTAGGMRRHFGAFDGIASFLDLRSWLRASGIVDDALRSREVADQVFVLRTDPNINLPFLEDYETRVLGKYAPNETVSAADLNTLLRYAPELVVEHKGLRPIGNKRPTLTAAKVRKLLAETRSYADARAQEAARASRGMTPELTPEILASQQRTARALGLRVREVETLQAAAKGIPDEAPPASIVNLVAEVTGVPKAELLRDPAGTWKRAVEWWTARVALGQLTATHLAAVRRIREEVKVKLTSQLEGILPSDRDVIDAAERAILNPIAEGWLTDHPHMQAPYRQAMAGLQMTLDELGKWAKRAPQGAVTASVWGVRHITRSISDLTFAQKLIERVIDSGRLAKEEADILRQAELNPFVKIDEIIRPRAGDLPPELRPIIERVPTAEDALAPAVRSVLGEDAVVTPETIARAEQAFVRSDEQLVEGMKMLRSATAWVDVEPTSGSSHYLNDLRDRLDATYGTFAQTRGKRWANQPVSLGTTRTIMRDIAGPRRTALEREAASLEDRLRHIDSQIERMRTEQTGQAPIVAGREVYVSRWRTDADQHAQMLHNETGLPYIVVKGEGKRGGKVGYHVMEGEAAPGWQEQRAAEAAAPVAPEIAEELGTPPMEAPAAAAAAAPAPEPKGPALWSSAPATRYGFSEPQLGMFGGTSFADARATTVPRIEGAEARIVDPFNEARTIPGRYELVDLDNLVSSDRAGYPASLQPRQRGQRIESDEQVFLIARDLQPELLTGHGAAALERGSEFAPVVVGTSGVVLSGNGRVMALREAAASYPKNMAAYRAHLRENAASFGLTPEMVDDMAQPVLVRAVSADAATPALAGAMNERMSSTEWSRVMALAMDDTGLARLQETKGDLLSAVRANPSFAKRALEGVPRDQARTFTKGGTITEGGAKAIATALLLRVMGAAADESLVRVLESPSQTPAVRRAVSGISNAAVALAHAIARANAGDAVGTAAADLTPHLAAAVRRLELETRAKPPKHVVLAAFARLAGGGATGDERIANEIARAMYKAASVEDVDALVRAYADVVTSSVPTFEGGYPRLTTEQTWALTVERFNEAIDAAGRRNGETVARARNLMPGSPEYDALIAAEIRRVAKRRADPMPDEYGVRREPIYQDSQGATHAGIGFWDAIVPEETGPSLRERITAEADARVFLSADHRRDWIQQELDRRAGEAPHSLAADIAATVATTDRIIVASGDEAVVAAAAGRAANVEAVPEQGLLEALQAEPHATAIIDGRERHAPPEAFATIAGVPDINPKTAALAAEIAQRPGETVLTGADAQLAAAVGEAAHGAPIITEDRGRVIHVNEPDYERQIRMAEGLRAELVAKLDKAKADHKELTDNPPPPEETLQSEFWPDPEYADLYARLNGADTNPLAPSFPRTIGEAYDAMGAIEGGWRGGLTDAEAQRVYDGLRMVLEDTLGDIERHLTDAELRMRAGKLKHAKPRAENPEEIIDPEAWPDELEEVGRLMAEHVQVRQGLPEMDEYSGTQYAVTFAPERNLLTGEPIAPRIPYVDRFGETVPEAATAESAGKAAAEARQSLIDRLNEIIPTLGDEIATGVRETWATRVANSHAARMLDIIAGSRHQKEIHAAAIDNLIGHVEQFHDFVDPDEYLSMRKSIAAIYREWERFRAENTINAMVVRNIPIHRRVGLLNPKKMNEIAEQVLTKGGEQALPFWAQDFRRAGQSWSEAWRRVDNRLRMRLAGKVGEQGDMGRFIDAVYNSGVVRRASDWGRGITVMYHVYRFLMDIRWLGLEGTEAPIMAGGIGGWRAFLQALPGREPKAQPRPMFTEAGKFTKRVEDWSIVMGLLDTGAIIRPRERAIMQLMRDRGPAEFGDVLRKVARRDESVRQMLRMYGDDVDTYIRRLDRDWQAATMKTEKVTPEQAREIYRPFLEDGTITQTDFDGLVKAERYTRVEGIERALAETVGNPAQQALLKRLLIVNEQMFNDLAAMMFGQPDRSNIQRIANHPLLFWPVGYQIKATKWLANILFDRMAGRETGMLGGFVLQRLWEEHVDRFNNDPDYADWFAKNKNLLFVAQMLLPITPWDVGVSLSPWTRLALSALMGGEEQGPTPADLLGAPGATEQGTMKLYQRNIFSVGPGYTYFQLLPRLLREQSKEGTIGQGSMFGEQIRGAQSWAPSTIYLEPIAGEEEKAASPGYVPASTLAREALDVAGPSAAPAAEEPETAPRLAP